jgi:hypothetical protein
MTGDKGIGRVELAAVLLAACGRGSRGAGWSFRALPALS